MSVHYRSKLVPTHTHFASLGRLLAIDISSFRNRTVQDAQKYTPSTLRDRAFTLLCPIFSHDALLHILNVGCAWRVDASSGRPNLKDSKTAQEPAYPSPDSPPSCTTNFRLNTVETSILVIVDHQHSLELPTSTIQIRCRAGDMSFFFFPSCQDSPQEIT